MHLYSGAQSSAELQPYKSLIMTSSLTRYLQIQTLKKYLTNWDRRFWISPESCYWDWGLKKAWSLRLEFFFPIWVDESPAASNKHTDFPHRLLCRWPQFQVFLKRKWYATSKAPSSRMYIFDVYHYHLYSSRIRWLQTPCHTRRQWVHSGFLSGHSRRQGYLLRSRA